MNLKKIFLSSQIVYGYKILFIAIFIINNIHGINLKEKVCNILLSPITSTDISDRVLNKTESIAQKIDPKAKVTVRNLNAFGRLLTGYKNTVSIPFINYILVNEKWLETLSSSSKDFVLARSMMYLLSNPYEYTIYKYLFPFLVYNFCINVNDYIKKYEHRIYISKKRLIQSLAVTLSEVLVPYYLRKIEYRFDAQSAINFNCFDGAIAAILDSTKFSHKGSFLDNLNSKVSLIEFADLAFYIVSLVTLINKSIFDINSNSSDILSPLKINDIEFPLKLFASPKFLIPGRFTDRQSAFFSFIKNLPLINLIFDYPKPHKRIKELTALRNRILKEKIKEELQTKNIKK
jgi:hypothetical protein